MDPSQVRSDGHRLAKAEAAKFLQGCDLAQPLRDRMQLALAHGDAGVLLHAHGATHPADLVVIGTEHRRGLLGFLIGSVAQRILEQAENDVLLVPPASADR